MQQLQSLIQGHLPPQQVDLQHLLALAEQHTHPASSEYKLLELAINMVLANYLEQALEHI